MKPLHTQVVFLIQAWLWSWSRVAFYRDLADAIRRRVGLRDHLQRQVSNQLLLKNPLGLGVMRHLALRHARGQGVTLRELMAQAAPRADALLLLSVDEAADKAQALEHAADAVAFQLQSFKLLLRHLLMPLVALPIVAALCIITANIIAGVAADAPPQIWSGFNGQVRAVAFFIQSHWPVLIAVLVITSALLVYSLPRWTGRLRLRFDELPVFSLYRDYHATWVLSSLAMMLAAGKTLRHALDDLRVAASPWLRWQLQRVVLALDDNPTDYLGAFSRGLMPRSVRARLASLLDASRSFDEALRALGSQETHRLQSHVELSAQALNWTLTSVLVALAVYLSIGQMTIVSALSREADPVRLMQSHRR